MNQLRLLASSLVAGLLLFFAMTASAQSVPPLPPRYQSIVTIAALTAQGNLPHLHDALGQGLDAGLTVSEAKEVLVQLYAYCGFPRSLAGINTLMKVLDERKAKGINNTLGREASPITATGSKYERGKQNLQQLTGREEKELTGANAFAPIIDQFLKEHLFADIFERDVLTFQERELATIAALVSLGRGVEPMLQSPSMGLHVGLTEAQLRQLISLSGGAVGKQAAAAALPLLGKALEAQTEK